VGDTVDDDDDGFAVGDFVVGASLLELDASISTGTSLLLNNRVGVVTTS
jgi:hypothetical protein